MSYTFDVGCSPPPSTRVCSHALCPARCVHCRRAPPLASRSRSAPLQPAPHRVSRACNPRQHAYAFNQPLSWDTSGVTNMQSMFDVRPNPHPQIHIPAHLVYLLQSAESRPVPRTLRVHTAGARATPPAFRGLQLAPHRAPCLRPLAGRDGLQPAAKLGHLRCHKHGGHVLRAPYRALPRTCTVTPAYCVHRDRAPVYPREARLATYTADVLLATRQDAHSLSAANKLLIRCAWAGTSALASAGYGATWAPGSCS